MTRNRLLRPLLTIRVWLAEWLPPSGLQVTLFWAGVIGFLGASSSLLFRHAIVGLQWLLTNKSGTIAHVALELEWWQRLIIPAAGGLCAGFILHFGLKLIRWQSSGDYMEAIALGDGVVRSRSTLVKSLSSLFSIASGGSIGREGSMVQLSAMIASLLGRKLHISTQQLRLFVACGAAAGITSAYNAPIAGALFVAEIIMGSIAMESFGPLVFSSVVAAVTLHQFWDTKPTYEMPPLHIASNWELPLYISLGLLCGLLAPWFLRILSSSNKIFSKIPLPSYARLMLGGLIVGAISISTPEVWGNGENIVTSMLQVHWEWKLLLLLLLFKVLATAATTGSGAVGGVFTPTLFVGATLGCLWGQLVQTVLPSDTSTLSVYTLVGMGAFLAATTHAPLMAILMLFEMTLNYQIILPLMLACVIAYYTSKSLQKDSIYSDSMRRKRSEIPSHLFQARCVGDLLKAGPPLVQEKTSFEKIAEIFASNHFNNIYVVGSQNRFRGAVSLHDLKPFLNDPNLAKVVIALDIVKEDFPILTPKMSLGEALQKFLPHAGERLPVVSNLQDRTLLGTASKTDLLLAMAQYMPEQN